MILKQLLALINLRIKLSRNQQIKAGSINFYISRIVFILLWISTIASFFATAVGGSFFFRAFSAQRCFTIWGVAAVMFLFYWALMVIGQLQQTETIAFEKLLHLPVSLKGAFLLNYLSSYANSATLIGAPVLLGLSIGIGFAKGGACWKLLPATLSLFVCVTALTYQLRNWFARIMKNKRVKAFAMLLIPCFIFTFFAILSMDYGESGSLWKSAIKDELRNSIRSGPSVGIIIAMLATGLCSLFLSYRSIVHQYYGTATVKTKTVADNNHQHSSTNFLFYRIPWISPEASAVTMASLRHLLRSPEMLAALIPIGVLAIFGGPYVLGWSGYEVSDSFRPWIPLGVITVNLLSFPAFLFSIFSYDRDGFRAFVLSPIKRSDILLGKNIAVGILTIASGVISLGVLQYGFGYPLGEFAASMIQLLVCFLFLAVIGNLLSVYFPVGLKRGTMQPTNAPILTTIFLYIGVLGAPVLVVQIASIACMIAMLVNGSFTEMNAWIYLGLSVFQLLIAIPVYFVTLRHFATALWYNQSKIVNTVANLPE